MKRILILGDINSSHIEKWVSSLVCKNFYIGLFSLSKSNTEWHKELPNFQLFDEHGFSQDTFFKKTFRKSTYLQVIPSLKKSIESFKPEIVHAHYASSYGLIGALSDFHPFIISVWGSDVFDFPHQNFICRKILRYNLREADLILSTSEAMKRETALYSDKEIVLTPFGIDLEKFKPATEIKKEQNQIVIGTVKRLEETYGISTLIFAFKKLVEKFQHLNLQLLLVGDGMRMPLYKKLVEDLHLIEKVTFTGRIPHSEVVEYHNRLDVFVAVSLRESFGVAVLEASACGKPVVVSDVGGLPEVVQNDITGFIVPSENVEATAAAIEKLILDKNLRDKFGTNGRKFVAENYDWNLCVEKMINIYNNVL